MKRVLRFFRVYKQLTLVIVASIAALILSLLGFGTAAHWILGTLGVVVTIALLIDMGRSLRDGSYGIDILAATAIITAIIMHEYWTAAIIMIMLTSGEALERYAQRRAQAELHDLLERAPQKAHVYRKKALVDIAVKLVRVDDTIVIRPGEVVPVDAVIIEGDSSFDESSLTGESLPIDKQPGDEILSGSINQQQLITAKVLRTADESQYQSLIRLVKNAVGSQSPFVRLADRYAVPFTIISFAIAGAAWIWSGDSLRFLQVLVVATPCPLILAAPIAIISGMSRASKDGIIIKNGSSLEKLALTRTVGFDKTGTLTHGTPQVDRLTTYYDFQAADVLRWAASLERHSNHVLAGAIVRHAEEQELKLLTVKHVLEQPGDGLSAHVAGHVVSLGRFRWLEKSNINLPPRFSAKTIQQTATYVAVDGRLAAVITFQDEVRSDSQITVARLRALGVKDFLLVTGDNQASAKKIGQLVGITEITAGALPADKLRIVEAAAERPVAFVGDGVNDAPVLTAADVGIALGAKGSTAASESADIVILRDELSAVADAFTIARRSLTIAQQSVLIGIGLSIILMCIFASGAFAPIYGAIIQEVVDVIVIFNAVRAHHIKL